MDNLEKAKKYQIISDKVLQDPLFNMGFGAVTISGIARSFIKETPETEVLSNTILAVGTLAMAASYLLNRFSGDDDKWTDKATDKTTDKTQSTEQISR
jgi:hypothetical protein